MDIGIFGVHCCDLFIDRKRLFGHVVRDIKFGQDGVIAAFVGEGGDQLLKFPFGPFKIIQVQVDLLLLDRDLLRNACLFFNFIIHTDGLPVLFGLKVEGGQLIEVVKVLRIFPRHLFINGNGIRRMGGCLVEFGQEQRIPGVFGVEPGGLQGHAYGLIQVFLRGLDAGQFKVAHRVVGITAHIAAEHLQRPLFVSDQRLLLGIDQLTRIAFPLLGHHGRSRKNLQQNHQTYI